MINIAEIRNKMRDIIIAGNVIPIAQYAWDNIIIDTAELDVWIQEFYLPVSEQRNTSDGNSLDGILQFNINSKIGVSDQLSVSKGVELGSLFENSEVIKTDNYSISIQNVQCSSQGKLDDLWYTYVVDIVFRAFEH